MVRRQHNAHKPVVELRAELLKSLAQAVRLVALYKAHHPVPAAALHECQVIAAALLKDLGAHEVSLGLVEGRWVIESAAVQGALLGVEGLADAFRARGLFTVSLAAGVRIDELASLCELLASAPDGVLPGDFLLQRGVRRVRVNGEAFARASEAKPRAAVESPIAAARRTSPAPAPSAPSASHHKLSGLSFGSFIKTLVDDAVADPSERAAIYGEVLGNVKQALERRVAESTKSLQEQSLRASVERRRMERLISTAAEGKVVVDRDGRVLMMDPIAEEIAGKPLSQLAGKPILSGADGEHMVALASEGTGSVEVAGDEEMIETLRQSTAVVQDEDGRVVGTYGVMPYMLKLREAMRAKDEFVAHVTHELKAPLSAITSALELVSDASAGKLSAQESRFLEISLKNTRQLAQMINEILDFSRLQSGQMSVLPVPTPLDAALKEAVDSLRPWAMSKKIRLKEAEECGLVVVADRNRLAQVMTNLISNAIKATPDGGCITVAAGPGTGALAGKAVICVKDTGCGIAADKHEAIFQRFTQAITPGQRREGVGLGLAIVRELVARHGGQVWVDSEPGRGAAFSISLPLAER